MKRGLRPFHLAVLAVGFGFLYLPIALLVIYSFNASRLVTVWGGFSTRWYGALLANDALIASAMVSLRVALVAAVLSTLLGTMAAFALQRFGRFGGRMLLAGLVYAPLVMPEVIIGLSLLLLFIGLDLDRGFWTIVVGHTTLGLCFVTVVVQARLALFDMSLEEAAMDLGATPATTFRRVTLPLIWPALAAGFLLAFTLSLDDFVLASFTSGPGSTTLPMRIYSQVRLGVTPEINAISTLLLGGVGMMLLIAAAMMRLRAPAAASR
jgi:putrescine transport system permease protein